MNDQNAVESEANTTVLDGFALVDRADIVTRDPFQSLFPIRSETLAAITQSMSKHGYDSSKPIDIWREQNVVVDGHTRLGAASKAGISEVPVCFHDFPDEDHALKYAIANQRNRRNLTDAELLSAITACDARRQKGGDRKSEAAKSKDSSEAIDLRDASPGGKSAVTTAEICGTSRSKVEKVRTIVDHAKKTGDSAELDAVRTGEMSINQASKAVKAKARPDANKNPPAKTSPRYRQRDQIRDDAHLARHPVGRQLRDRRAFDNDVRIYRAIRAELKAIKAKLLAVADLDCPGNELTFFDQVTALLSLAGPDDRKVCSACGGAGIRDDDACNMCSGGYTIPEREWWSSSRREQRVEHEAAIPGGTA